MKKVLAVAASTVMLMGTILINASAATVELKPVEEMKNVYEHSAFQYENNADLGISLYTRGKSGEQYMTFKAEGPITNFEVGLQKCAGFFDPENVTRDINFFVSSDNKSWTKVDVSEGPTTFNQDIYLNEKQAYWWNSTVKSKSISGSPTYLKIVVKDSPISGAPAWNIAIDSIKLTTDSSNSDTKTTVKDNSGNTNQNNNGKSPAQTTAKKNSSSPSPNTGDRSLPLASMVLLSILSLGALMTVKSKK